MTTQAKTKKTEIHDSPHYCPYCGHDGIASRGFSCVGTIYRCGECGKKLIISEQDKEELGNQ